jgi:hypothetical protein
MSMSAIHGFLMMGTNQLFLCHLPMFYMPPHSFQVILQADLPNNDMASYIKIRNENAGKPLIIQNVEEKALKDLSNPGSFNAQGYFADNDGDPVDNPFMQSTTIKVSKAVLFEQLNTNQEYPEKLTYYLYGTDSEFHLSHLLSKAPNFEQEMNVSLSGEILNKFKQSNYQIMKVSIPSLNEKNNQPITSDPLTQSEYPIRTDDGTTGSISIEAKFWINNTSLNMPM